MSNVKTMRVCFVVAVLCWAMAGFAQELKPVQTADVNRSRIDLFAGYSHWAPHGSVNGFQYKADDQGMIFSGAYFFNRCLGGQIEVERAQQTANDGMRAFSVGPLFRYPTRQGFTPIAHFLMGAAGVTGPNEPTINNSGFYFNPERWGMTLTLGGGIDYATPLLHQSLSIRLLQADYQYTHVDFGPLQTTTGGRANIDAARLSVGIVYSMGSVTSSRRWRLFAR